MKLIPVSEPNISDKELQYITDAVKSSWISSNGKYLDAFEKKFAEYIGVKYAVAVSNGTVALHLALLALGIGPGDEVIVPNLTYIATANAVKYVGASPAFADSDINTWNISIESIKRLITRRTKAIIPVHLYGNPCDMDGILELANEQNLFVIEDAAEAIGSKYNKKHVGSFGHISTFSLYGNKTITTGEGGVVVTNDVELYDKLKLLKGQGMNPKKRYWFDVIGYNYRMTNMQAAIGCAQLERVNELVDKKIKNAKIYNKYFSTCNDIILPMDTTNSLNSYWMYTIVLESYAQEERDYLMKRLLEKNIETRPVFYLTTEMPMYTKHRQDECRNATLIANGGINLPSSTLLNVKEIDYICSNLINLLAKM